MAMHDYNGTHGENGPIVVGPQPQTEEFRAVLECRQDPCRGLICAGRRAERFPVEHPKGPFPSEEAARQHGRGMASHVYGGEHRVLVESRTVTPWEETR